MNIHLVPISRYVKFLVFVSLLISAFIESGELFNLFIVNFFFHFRWRQIVPEDLLRLSGSFEEVFKHYEDSKTETRILSITVRWRHNNRSLYARRHLCVFVKIVRHLDYTKTISILFTNESKCTLEDNFGDVLIRRDHDSKDDQSTILRDTIWAEISVSSYTNLHVFHQRTPSNCWGILGSYLLFIYETLWCVYWSF